jgi:hypothetical protein
MPLAHPSQAANVASVLLGPSTWGAMPGAGNSFIEHPQLATKVAAIGL